MTATTRHPEDVVDVSVDVRLCHLPGRPDLALIRMAAPPGALDGCGDALRAVGPRIGDCVAAGELSSLAVALHGADAELGDRDPDGLAAQVAAHGLPLVLLLDGVRGAPVDALARVADRVVLGGAQPHGALAVAPAALERRDATGADLVAEIVAELRAAGVPALS